MQTPNTIGQTVNKIRIKLNMFMGSTEWEAYRMNKVDVDDRYSMEYFLLFIPFDVVGLFYVSFHFILFRFHSFNCEWLKGLKQIDR